jgi:hypothetical protein
MGAATCSLVRHGDRARCPLWALCLHRPRVGDEIAVRVVPMTAPRYFRTAARSGARVPVASS